MRKSRPHSRTHESRSNLGAMANKSKAVTAILAVAAVISLATGGCFHWSSKSQAPANPAANPAAAEFATALRNKVSTDAMMKHLAKLQDIANANNGTRAVGTPGYEASVD